MRDVLAERQRGVVLTAHALARDLETAEAVDALRTAGVRSIVLKGPSIARWLYRDGTPRPYSDSDLLVSPDRLGAAARALDSIGYDLHLDDRLVPSRDAHHEWWRRRSHEARLELHWRLPGVTAPAKSAWRMLSMSTEVTSLAGVEVEFLGLPARALHLALHAAQHGPELAKPFEDLRRGIRIASCWPEAAALAAAIGAQDAFAAGLRAIPEGAELASRLELPRTRSSTIIDMQVQGASRRSVLVQKLICSRGLWGTGRELLRVAFPSRDYMRFYFVRARSGRRGLAATYARRLISLAGDFVSVLRTVARANLRAHR